MESDSTPSAPATPESAAASLDLVRQTRADLADRLVTPWWYHPILGLVEAALVVSFALPTPWRLLVVVLALAALGGVVRAYSQLTGLAAYGGSYPAMARGWILSLLAVIIVALALALFVDSLPVTVAAAVLAFVATVVFGRRADASIRARLRAGIAVP